MTPSMMTTGCKPRVLFLDTETYSETDIRSAGAYKYMEDPSFEILLLPYAWNDEPARVLDLTDKSYETYQELQDIIAGLNDPDVIKVAHNTPFERGAYRRQFGFYQPPEQWVDTMILCAMNGLPMSLDAAGAALRLQEQKIKEGTALINYFCKPCKPTIKNGGRTRNLPEHDPEKWARFKEYALRDVDVERDIFKRLGGYTVSDFERRLWALDVRINERGVLVDTELAEAAVAVDEAFAAEHSAEMQKLTGLDNPNSVAQLKDWLAALGVECESLNKATVSDLKADTSDRVIKRVLELRQLLGKTSTTKYKAMLAAACADNRVRGLLQYYGAGRTGRWAGRLVQVQNLPQNHLDDIDKVRELVRARDLDTLELLFDSVPDVLSQLIRTAFVAKPGHTFHVADYAAIEARVIAYLAGEAWRMEVFAKGGDIYCSSASQMFKVPVEKHGVNGHLRQKGKVAELACGYGGGVGALKAFGADKMGLSEEEMQDIVTQWRLASPTIPKLWRRVEDAAKAALGSPGRRVHVSGKVYDPERARENERATGAPAGSYSPFFNGSPVCTYWRDRDALRCRLPSGRVLTYWEARIEDGSIVFMGQNQTTRKWEKTETWGGKLVENIVQAVARDCLAVSMLRLDEAGYDIVFTVHDEIIAEAPEDTRWEDMAEIMGRPIEWAPGLLLRGDGYSTKFYMKD
jgi:DNA polymerase